MVVMSGWWVEFSEALTIDSGSKITAGLVVAFLCRWSSESFPTHEDLVLQRYL